MFISFFSREYRIDGSKPNCHRIKENESDYISIDFFIWIKLYYYLSYMYMIETAQAVFFWLWKYLQTKSWFVSKKTMKMTTLLSDWFYLDKIVLLLSFVYMIETTQAVYFLRAFFQYEISGS